MPRFGLLENDFWDSPFKEIPEIPETPGPELELAAPKLVPLRDRSTLPLVVHRAALVTEIVRVPFEKLAIVTAIDVDRNILYAAFAQNPDDIAPGPEDLDLSSEGVVDGTTIQPYLVEARERVDLPWQPAEYLVTVLLRDKVSNRERVKLGAAPSAHKDAAVAEFLESKRGEIGAEPESPRAASPYPSYEKLPESPPLPDAGIALALDRVVVLRGTPRCMMRGSFRLPVRKQDLVPAKADYPQGHKRPTAVLGITLLVTGSEVASPLVVRLRVPTYDAATDGAELTGYFTLDLYSVMIPARVAQTYFVYAFSREVMVGPIPTATVTPDMLPPGAF